MNYSENMEEKTQEEKPKKFNKMLIFAVVLYIGIALSGVTYVIATNYVNEEKWEYENNRDLVDALMDSGVYKYAEYSTSGLKDIDTTTPYIGTNCNYTSEQGELAEKNKIDQPCLFWAQLNSAKFDFHAKTMKVRILASEPVKEALDNVENGFMDVFDKVINEEYYMRTYQDNYNLIMPSLFEELEGVLRGELE